MSTSNPVSRLLSGIVARSGHRILRSARLMRAPILVYRARLGIVFGSRMLMLEHVGRRSGLRRQVVLEVIEHPAPDAYVVASGFGDRAQWYRNVQACPRVRVSVGRRVSVPATARVLEPSEADGVLRRYTARHPRAWRRLKPVIEATLGAPVTEEHTGLPMVEFRFARAV